MKRYNATNNKWLVGCFFVLAVTLVAGCAGQYGQLRHDPNVTGKFVQKQMHAGYNYYYTGREVLPYAIVGIKSDYTLDTKFWKPIERGTGAFERMVDRLYGSQHYPPRGAEIVDPRGAHVGLWYSVYAMTRIRFDPGNQVNVFSPYSPSRHSGLFY